jgi:hypothetical protein
MWRLALVFLVAGCFDPKPETGLLCDGTRCPPGQVCYSDGYCRFLPEAGSLPGNPDAGGGGPPDAALPAGDCTYFPQDGCSGTDACHVYCDGTETPTECLPAGAGREGERCVNNGSCAAGYSCISVGSLLTCRRGCLDDNNCSTSTGSRCFSVQCGGVVQPDWNTCTASCNPLTGGGCPSSSCWIFNDSDNLGYTVCGSPGGGGQGTACESYEDCGIGFACLTSGCAAYCVVGQTVCGGGNTCRAFNPARIVGGLNYGVCVL